jgi:hypothetical protein
MAGPTACEPTTCEKRQTKILASCDRHRDAIVAGHLDAKEETASPHSPNNKVQLVRTWPSVDRNSAV